MHLKPRRTATYGYKERRFIPLRLDDAPIKGAQARFHHSKAHPWSLDFSGCGRCGTVLSMTYEQLPDEWKEWLDLTPLERFHAARNCSRNTWRWEAALIPTPIRQVLSTIRKHRVQALLMGGQACVFYGAAQFSKDVDLALLASEENFTRLRAALDELQAARIAVPRFDPALLARGHAVHFRCQHPAASGLRVDVMTSRTGQGRAYWEPLKRELESLRLAEARERGGLNTG